MTAQVLTPYAITAAEISATNVAFEADYAGGESLTKGDLRKGSDGLAYEYRGTDGTTHDAPTDEGQTDWVLIGPMNYLRPFDIQRGVEQENVIQTRAENADTITYTVSGLGRVMGIAFENVEALAITLVITETTTGDILNETYLMQDLANISSSFWRYLNYPLVPETEYRRLDLNVPPGCTFEITVDNTGGTAKVGAIVMGIAQELGEPLLGASWGLASRSVIQFDGFKTTLVRYDPGADISVDIKVPVGSERAVRQVLKTVDGVAAIWETRAERPEFTVYGVLEDVTLTARTEAHSFLSLSVKAL